MPPVAMTLRPARSFEAEALALMSRDLVEAGLGWRYRPEAVRNLIKNPDTVVLIARVRVRVVGFAIMKFGQERAHLVLLAVEPAYRRRGIGRRMLEWLIESAVTAGIASIHLELRADNHSALAFYRALEFVEMARIPGYYLGREAALRMVRLLRPEGLAPVRWRPPTLRR